MPAYCFLLVLAFSSIFFFFQAEDGIRDLTVTGVQTCALPISRRRLAEPEGNRWWLALGVDDAHLARLDFLDQIGPVAQLEDVARHTLDGEILVERSDEGLRRLEDHPVVADVRNRPARRERGEPGAAARA